jgi:iron complex transport system substrate-binding protein
MSSLQNSAPRPNRRSLLAFGALATASAVVPRATRAQSTPIASPISGEWTFTDVIGTTVTLPQRPTRISAYLNQAAALWDFGIHAETTFGWTAAHFPDGDHIAWGNIDVDAVEMIGDTDGNVDLEKLVASKPELIVTWTWNRDDVTNATNGFPADVLDRVREIAPIIVLNQGDPDDVELARIEELATALGADLDAPALVSDREALDAKLDEFASVVAEKSDLTAIFASYGEPGVYYVASPDYVADVGYARTLGLKLANDGSPDATQYWEEISTEQALKYPSDIVYLDAYGALNTLEAVQAEKAINLHPAIAAGQVGYWSRDFPLNYAGLTGFLESLLAPLRTATKVS